MWIPVAGQLLFPDVYFIWKKGFFSPFPPRGRLPRYDWGLGAPTSLPPGRVGFILVSGTKFFWVRVPGVTLLPLFFYGIPGPFSAFPPPAVW